jgi:hypothetical protein
MLVCAQEIGHTRQRLGKLWYDAFTYYVHGLVCVCVGVCVCVCVQLVHFVYPGTFSFWQKVPPDSQTLLSILSTRTRC